MPVAKGWLRASHRELDPDLSLPHRPYHRHTRRQFLKPGEIVKVEARFVFDGGAYASTSSPVLLNAITHTQGPYR